MDKFSVLVICAIFSVFVAGTTAVTIQPPNCCGFFGTVGGFGVFAPPNVQIECHSPNHNDFRASPAFTGYGYQASGCPQIPQCGGTITCNGADVLTDVNPVSRVLFTNDPESFFPSCGGNSGAGRYDRQFCGDRCNGGAFVCSPVQSVTVADTVAPVLGVPGTVNLECGLNAYTLNTERAESGFANYYDLCTRHVALIPTITDSTSFIRCGGSTQTPTYTRQYTLADPCNNVRIDTQTINIVDTLPPILRNVFDETIEVGGTSSSNPQAEDTCFPLGSLVVTPSTFVYPGRCPAESTIERVYVVSDPCGNSRRYSSILTVQDTLPPTCSDGGPVTSQDFSILCTAYPPPQPTISCLDSSGGAVTVTLDEYDSFQLLDPDNDESREALDLTLVRNYTATDGCGNTLNWVYRYHINSVSVITFTPPSTAVTILPGKTGLINFSFTVGNCPLRRARLHYDVYPLVLTGVGSTECTDNNARMVVGDSYCAFNSLIAANTLVTVNVEVYVPFTFEQDKLVVHYEITALNQLDLSSGSYGEVIIHTA